MPEKHGCPRRHPILRTDLDVTGGQPHPLIYRRQREDRGQGGPVMTRREALHHLIDELPDEQTELARLWLEDLRNAVDENGPPLDAEALASLDRGLADVAAGRVKPLAEYERERGL